jgi:dTDP-4-amino-4,6-dideoxygalactose transaminase
VVVNLYGQSADMAPIIELCDAYGVAVVEDAAESLGASYRGRASGTWGRIGIYSFNGNKIITTSGGGMLISDNAELVERARFLATQARDPAPWYLHTQMGYNYRLSNLLAAVGRAQLADLPRRVARRRAIRDRYARELGGLPGWALMPEAPGHHSTAWLTCATIDAAAFGASRDQVLDALAAADIEARPVWKPMHLQPVFAGARAIGGTVAADLFARGLCLPSGSGMSDAQQARVIEVVRATGRR